MTPFSKTSLPEPQEAIPGRKQVMSISAVHYVNGHSMQAPFAEHLKLAVVGMGCFWGAERQYWQQQGVYATAVGYAAGYTENPSYEEVCSGRTGHNEVLLVVYDETIFSYEMLIKLFFVSHNPTQGMRQGNDQGTQYRSGIYYYSPQQQQVAIKLKDEYQLLLCENSKVEQPPEITTEILAVGKFYYAEEYHQQYLAKNPNGYCGIGGTGVSFKSH